MSSKPRAHALADFLVDQAAWREAKAREFPDDPRNRRAAEGLDELARYIRKLGEDDPRILSLERAGAFDPADGRLMVGDQALRWASSFRFNRPDEGFEPFLRVFIDLLRADREKAGRTATTISVGGARGMEEIVVQVHDRDRGMIRKKFVARTLIRDFDSSDPQVTPGFRFTVYGTQGGRYAVYRERDGHEGRLDVFDDVEGMEGELPDDLIAQLRSEPPLEILDI